jgi:hypothetical protein
VSHLRQADAVGQHLAAEGPLPALSVARLNRSRYLLTDAEYGEQHLCLILPAAKGSKRISCAANVQAPEYKLTAVFTDGFVRRKRHCGDRNLPQTATAAENHSGNGLLETSNGTCLI